MNKGRVLFLTGALLLVHFIAAEGQVVKDADGNIYLTINIGKQTWMAENLKTTRFNDGAPIPLVRDVDAWKSLKSPGYCFYNNEEKNKDVFGAL